MLCIINNRDYLTWPARMAEKLFVQGHEVVIIDNASTYQPLLDWYKVPRPITVVPLKVNAGPLAPWLLAADGFLDLGDEPYVVTDPDLDLSTIPDDWDRVLLEGLAAFPEHSKVGFSLDESRVPSDNPAWELDRMCDHPQGNPDVWGRGVTVNGRVWHPWSIDTTFALYRAGTKKHVIDGMRADRPYTARHLPWHIVLGSYREDSLQIPMTDEIAYYLSHASKDSVTAGRMQGMVEVYERTKKK